MKTFKQHVEAFQKITVKDKSGKSHTHGAVRLRPGDTHVAIQHYDALPAKKAIPGLGGASAVDAHTVLSFGSMDKLTKVINHAKKKFGLKRVEIQKIDKKYLDEVAPPGKEKMIKKLKKKFGADSDVPFKIAWSQHNKGK